MIFMPFGHVWRPPPALNLAPMPLGRGCPAAGAFTGRSGQGEGLLLKNLNTLLVLDLIAAPYPVRRRRQVMSSCWRA